MEHSQALDARNKEKFIELHNNKQLYAPEVVAKEFVSIIRNPEKIQDEDQGCRNNQCQSPGHGFFSWRGG